MKLPGSDAPTHLLDDDHEVFCRAGSSRERPTPRVMLRFAAAHVRGHGMVVCAGCAEAAGWRR